jgi:hypothetical protein
MNDKDYQDLNILLYKEGYEAKKAPSFDKSFKRLKKLPLFKVQNLESSLRGKFIDKFSKIFTTNNENLNINSSKASFNLPLISQKQNLNLVEKENLRPKKDKIDEKNLKEKNINLDHFYLNFNKELGRLSNKYGKDSSTKKFGDNNNIDFFINCDNFNKYKLKVSKNDKGKLLPIHISKSKSVERISLNLFQMYREKDLINSYKDLVWE